MPVNGFGGTRLGAVHSVTLGSPPGPVLELLDLGATVHRLWVTGGDGVRRNVVLGYGTAEEYLEGSDYLGATVGRYANRIAGGRFPLDGRTVLLATNEGGHTLHGGPEGFHRRIWDILEATERSATLGLVSPDGDQGFPGRLVTRARWEVGPDGLSVTLTAVTDAPTVVSLTSHVYLNLDGDASGSVARQVLAVSAGKYLQTDAAGIPGRPAPVTGTAFDLRDPSALGELLAATGGLDHAYLLDGAGLRPVAWLESPGTATRVVLSTDLPGLQVYSGSALDRTGRSSTGHAYGPADGLALEPELLPDTPNRPDLGQAVLRPGETWSATISWRFEQVSSSPAG